MSHCHQMSSADAIQALKSSSQGLSREEAQRRLAEHGANVLIEAKQRSPLAMFIGQFTDVMILILMAAALISGLIGEAKDAIAIVTILVLNAAIGFIQEYRAERAIAALRAMAAPTATVIREGRSRTLPAAEVVLGDVVALEAGVIVPADLRLLEAAHLRVDEASLTGESVPVEKISAPLIEADLPLGDRRNMAYKGTVVTYGRGNGLVVATGMRTEFGKIAALLHGVEDVKTPLQRRLAHFGRQLAIAALVICAIVSVAGIMRGQPPFLMLLTAVSLAVAAIPEALPAVVTIALALGARKMVQKQALVRQLAAVETLGSVTYICSDKTGTMTLNQMQVEEFYCDGVLTSTPRSGEPWDELLRAMALCSDATLDTDGAIAGDPTEVALVAAAKDVQVAKLEMEKAYVRVAEIPFDADRKCMTTIHRDPMGGYLSYTKGALEVILEKSAQVLTASGVARVQPQALIALSESRAAEGLRVLAFGMRRWETLPEDPDPNEVERALTLLGFVALMDPPREEVREAVETCKAAGLVPVMITGDHPLTATAIARRLGILEQSHAVMSGQELAKLSQAELEGRAATTRVYARVAPEQKLKIVRALQARGELVAMTGDGVNDAPALKQADIGVAMGVTGTDVAKQASAMVLLDDNFATIVRAVREGRQIYDNIRRFIKYVVATNSGEIWTMFLAPFLGLPLPLVPIQILWINLVTDSLPGLALTAEPEEPNIMHRPPRSPQESIFAHGLGIHVLWVGPLMAALTLGTQTWSIATGSTHWQTMVFTILCLSQLAHVLAIRSERESLFTLGLFSNRPLLGAVILTFVLQMATVYLPMLNGIFKTAPLSPMEVVATLAVSSVVFFAVEGEKWLKRRKGLSHHLQALR